MRQLILAVIFALACGSIAAARTVPLPNGTFTIRPVHGDPILVSNMEIEDDLIFYTDGSGQEQFIHIGNVANSSEVFSLLKIKTGDPSSEELSGSAPGQPTPSGEATVDLGRKSLSFGSAEQARALLGLMERQPGKASYQITYQTSGDVVIFGLDRNKDTIARLHQRMNGTGTGERWTGHVDHRLHSAASGGSLNDTPGGKSPGTIERF